MLKPHITRKAGWWITSIAGDEVFADLTLQGAFTSARILWRHQ